MREGLVMHLQEKLLFRTMRGILVVLLLGSVACASGKPEILIAEPEAKLSPAILGVASVFMKIVNSGNGDDQLLSARTDLPGAITELHEEKNGKMATVSRMDVPANGSLMLRPGGRHIMVYRIPRTMTAGSELRIVMIFKVSGERTLIVKLSEYATSAPRARHH
jgi:copper(I)-binding protein